MKNLIFTVLAVFGILSLQAQQNDDLKFNIENQFINNPAAISSFNELRASAYYLKQFSQVENAPTDMFVSFQSPIPYQRVMVGAAIMNETAGLIQDLSINLSGAYKLPHLLSRGDYLSVGTGFTFNQLGIDGNNIDLAEQGDPLSNIGDSKALSFNVSLGALYSSSSKIDYRHGGMEYQIGFSSTKTIPQNINFTSFSVKETFVLSGYGALFIPVSNTLINPYVEAQFEDSSLLNANLGVRGTFNSLILGVSSDTDFALGFQAGYRLADFMNGGDLQILGQAVIPTGTIDKYINPGYGISIQYIIDMTNTL